MDMTTKVVSSSIVVGGESTRVGRWIGAAIVLQFDPGIQVDNEDLIYLTHYCM